MAKGFAQTRFRSGATLEAVTKEDVLRSLKEATRATKTKGEYHKTRHAPEILERIRLQVVRGKAPACNRLFEVLVEEINRQQL